MPTTTHTNVSRAASAVLCCCAGVALSAAPAHAAATDYRCATLGGTGGTYADLIVMVHIPDSPIVGVNCRSIQGDGGDQVLLYGGKDGNPGFVCTSFRRVIPSPLPMTGVGAGCTRIIPEPAPEEEPAQQSRSKAKAAKSKAKAAKRAKARRASAR